ncbi:methyltransferase family protein [Leptospira hartskeerlii]|uniref:methyltransferase family protein n=1 Tax=Leptospira hartskeerlii TaxID=2023177 RepID=UPI001FAE7B90|nr:NnrU family protein [Leptospira hartskeerlii]
MNLSSDNTLKRITYIIFALISYMIYLFAMTVFILRLLDATQFLKVIAIEFQIELVWSIYLDIALIAMFGIPHSVMARAGFKKYFSRIIPLPIERSFYVLISSITLIALSCLWQPINFEIWNIKTNFWMYVIHFIFLIGILLAVVSTFLIDHFELFGLKQAWNYLIKTEPHAAEFVTPSLYKLVRHPMMLGIILVLWSTPVMNIGHLILSSGLTLYIIIGTFFEERDLVHIFGEKYLQYKRAVPILLPFIKLKQNIKSEKEI